MILKDAYRYQKCLSTMIGQAETLLLNNSFVTSTTQKHNRKKANSEAEDEIIEVDKPITDFTAMDVINFIADAIKEKQKISDAIVTAKRNTDIDIDSSISLNKIKQEYIGYLRRLAAMDSSERKTYGTDYKFDVDGKQTSYRYEVIETTTIDFDRNDVRGLAKKLQKECDNISSKLDLIELTTDVEFTPKWDVNDTLEEIITSTK
mgnify:FL=1|nr:MAG TPA: hypothetical protein [Bacteriophage sp.]